MTPKLLSPRSAFDQVSKIGSNEFLFPLRWRRKGYFGEIRNIISNGSTMKIFEAILVFQNKITGMKIGRVAQFSKIGLTIICEGF